MDQLKFIADSMLGTLARRLRMLGIDTLYLRDAEDSELKYIVRSQDRILLTRDRNLFRDLPGCTWLVNGRDVRGEFLSINSQLLAVSHKLKPLSLCLECNGRIEPLQSDEVRSKVPPYVLKKEKRFMGCPDCGKIYWEGTHSSSMKQEINWMRGTLEEGKRGKV
jgi:uncharacterized protein with PIN domain